MSIIEHFWEVPKYYHNALFFVFSCVKVRGTILFSVEVGKLVHVMQKERDLSVLYLSSIGPETKTFLTQRYMDTNEQLANLTSWPADLDLYGRDYFESKRYKNLSNWVYNYIKMPIR